MCLEGLNDHPGNYFSWSEVRQFLLELRGGSGRVVRKGKVHPQGTLCCGDLHAFHDSFHRASIRGDTELEGSKFVDKLMRESSVVCHIASLNFFTTINSLPRSSMTFTAIWAFLSASKGALTAPAR